MSFVPHVLGALRVLVLMLGLTGTAHAFALTVSGKITSIDHGDGSFTLQTGLPAPAMFRVSRVTAIARGPEPLPFDALSAGDVVTVEYVKGEGERAVQVIRVKSKVREPASIPRP